jgi:hypothetical protein
MRSIKTYKHPEVSFVTLFQVTAAVTEVRLTRGLDELDLSLGAKKLRPIFADPLTRPPQYRHLPTVQPCGRGKHTTLATSEQQAIRGYLDLLLTQHAGEPVTNLFSELIEEKKLVPAAECTEYNSININGSRFRKWSVDKSRKARDCYTSYFWQYIDARSDELRDWTDWGRINKIIKFQPFIGKDAEKLDELIQEKPAYGFFKDARYLCFVGVFKLSTEDHMQNWIEDGVLPQLISKKPDRQEVCNAVELNAGHIAIWKSSDNRHFVINRQNLILHS